MLPLYELNSKPSPLGDDGDDLGDQEVILNAATITIECAFNSSRVQSVPLLGMA